MVYNGLKEGRVSLKFHLVDDAPQFYLKYRTSSNGINWSSWGSTAVLNVQPDATGTENLVWALSAGTVFQAYVIMTGPDKDESNPSNTIEGIVPATPIQSPPYIEVYPVYKDGGLAAQIFSNAFPSAATHYFIWKREVGQTEWSSFGYADGRSVTDSYVSSNKSYEYIAAWYDSSVPKFISDFSNIASVTIPDSSSTVLMAPIRYAASFVEQNGEYYNRLDLGAGDMRATATVVQYKINNGSWYPEATMTWSEASLAVFSRYIMARYSNAPVPYDKWTFRLKNRANGYTDSAWSELFELTVPSLLPRLDTPTLAVYQQGEHVLAGWQSIANAAGYKVERMQEGQSSYSVIATLPSSSTSYEDFGVSVGYTYYYRLTALGDNQYYQDSLPDVKQITISSAVIVPAPVIDSLAESGVDIKVTISNLDLTHTSQYRVEMSENNGSWRDLFGDYPSSMSVSTFTMTVAGKYIMEGGNLRFRVRVIPLQGAEAPNPYSEIASITIAEREWLLRWTGSAWDYCTSITGGWYAPAWTDSDGTHSPRIAVTDLGNGTLRVAGTGGTTGYGYWTNQTGLTTNNASLSSKYSKVCMIGTLVKAVQGENYHAWFGTAWDYTFARGWNLDTGRGTKTIAGKDDRVGQAGSVDDPYVNACGTYTYAPRDGAHVYFYFDNGYADIKGIYAIKR